MGGLQPGFSVPNARRRFARRPRRSTVRAVLRSAGSRNYNATRGGAGTDADPSRDDVAREGKRVGIGQLLGTSPRTHQALAFSVKAPSWRSPSKRLRMRASSWRRRSSESETTYAP